MKTQAQFAKDQKLNFPLLSDPDGSAADKYGVNQGRYAARVTFVIDPKGVLRLVDDKVDVMKHGGDLVDAIYRMQGD